MLSFAVCCTILLMSEYRYSQSSRWSLSKCSSLDASSNETAAMVIKGDQNQDVSDHKEQADLFAQFYESLAIPSNEEHFDIDHLEDCEYRYSLINNKPFGIFPDCMILLNKLTMLGTILSPAYLKCSAVSVYPSIKSLFGHIRQSKGI
jgi:hypothetical protein